MTTNLTEKLRGYEALGKKRETPCEWETDTSVKKSNYWVLSATESAAFDDDVVVTRIEGARPNDAEFIAVAPAILDLARKQHELLVMAERALNDAHLFAYAHGRRINSVEEVYAALHAAGIGE